MASLAYEVLLSTALPALAFALAAAMRRVLLPRQPWLDAVAFAAAYAAGQVRVLGALPWPPRETLHGLPYLGLVLPALAVSAREGDRRKPWITCLGTALVLNVGLYLALYPRFGTVSCILQWALGHGVVAASFAAWPRLPRRVRPLPWIAISAGLGAWSLAAGSTSLAMSAVLLAAMASAEHAVGQGLRGKGVDQRPLLLSVPVLLFAELYNYVL